MSMPLTGDWEGWEAEAELAQPARENFVPFHFYKYRHSFAFYLIDSAAVMELL